MSTGLRLAFRFVITILPIVGPCGPWDYPAVPQGPTGLQTLDFPPVILAFVMSAITGPILARHGALLIPVEHRSLAPLGIHNWDNGAPIGCYAATRGVATGLDGAAVTLSSH